MANTGPGEDSDMEGLESSEVRQQHQHVVSMFIFGSCILLG